MPNQEVATVQQQDFLKLASLAGITLSPKILRWPQVARSGLPCFPLTELACTELKQGCEIPSNGVDISLWLNNNRQQEGWIVLELLELNVDPVMVHELLRKIFSRQRSNQSRGSSRSGNTRKSSHSSDTSLKNRQEKKKEKT